MFTKLIIALIILMPTVNAWSWDTHQNIIEYVYLSLPIETQIKLNLTKLKEGAIIPDKDFKDHKKHHYPASLKEAEKWLNNATDLSLSLGIASHYITDSFAAPHNIFGEDYKLHSYFENQVDNYYPKIECKDYNLELDQLSEATKNSKDWGIWLKNKDKRIPQKEVDESAKLLFSITLKKLNTTCGTKTSVEEVPYFTKNKILIIALVIILGLYILKN